MNPRPRVSVIITTYNRATLLMEAVNSVLAQRFQDHEIVVADDGSTDDTPERVRSLQGSIRYVRFAHSGRPEVVRNRALALTRGDLIAFLDDDDLWHQDKLASQVEVLEQAEVGFVYSNVQALRPDGSLSAPLLSPRQQQSQNVFDELLTGCFVHPSTVLIRRDLLEQLGFFDEQFYSQGDYDLWLRAAYLARAACAPTPLVYIRQYTDGLSQKRDLLHYQNAIRVIEHLGQTLPLTLSQRLRSRGGLARLYAHVGIALLAAGQVQQARHHLLDSVRLNPLQRRPWHALITSYR
ncbi:MAG: glycosyltransferase family 2 protein [Chloroflexota bacterium]|nr:glycosyltransferase family 2 protein [Chloroflexota bacterium]